MHQTVQIGFVRVVSDKINLYYMYRIFFDKWIKQVWKFRLFFFIQKYVFRIVHYICKEDLSCVETINIPMLIAP